MSKIAYSFVTTTPRTTAGSRQWCVKVTNGFAQFGQDLSLKNATSYTLSAWFRVSAAATTTTAVTVGVGLQAGYSPWNLWASKFVTITQSQSWQQVNLTNARPSAQPGSSSGSPVPSFILLYVNTPATTVCVDDAFAIESGACVSMWVEGWVWV